MNELQKDDVVKAGGLGSVWINGKLHDITATEHRIEKGYTFMSTTYTLRPPQPEEIKTEDAEFEVLPPNQLENGKDNI